MAAGRHFTVAHAFERAGKAVFEPPFQRDRKVSLSTLESAMPRNFIANPFRPMYLSPVKSAAAFAIVLVTAPNLKTGRALANAALKAGLIACANLVPGIESHYRWKGKIKSSAEVLMILKTKTSSVAALERLVLAEHPYDTPEFLVLPLKAGNKKYLDWLAAG